MSEQDDKAKGDKKNTDLWKQKQEEKKKKKELEAQNKEEDASKADKKEKKKKDKKESNAPPDAKNIKTQSKISEGADLATQKVISEQEQAPPTYRNITKIDKILTSKERQSQIYQEELINKYLDQCLSQNDILLYVGHKTRTTTPQQVQVTGLNNSQQAELVCRYQDLSYFFEGSITKIFIEAEYIFSNGSILAQQGALSIALMGKYYNIPVVAVGGSWLYNGWAPVSHQALEERYGSQGIKELDWIEEKYIKSTILEVGPTNPRQVSTYPPIIYKQLSLRTIQW